MPPQDTFQDWEGASHLERGAPGSSVPLMGERDGRGTLGSQRTALFFHRVGFEAQTQVVKLGDRAFTC